MFPPQEPKVFNDYDEIARARAKIATEGTPLQYRLDGQWEARRQMRKTILLWLSMALLGLFLAWAGTVAQ